MCVLDLHLFGHRGGAGAQLAGIWRGSKAFHSVWARATAAGCAAATPQVRLSGNQMHAAVRAALADAVAQAQLLHRALQRWPSPLARAWLAQLDAPSPVPGGAPAPAALPGKGHPPPPVQSMKWHSK